MAKKPSEWTPQEAWLESARAHEEAWEVDFGAHCAPPILPFPADPPERVSDEELAEIGQNWEGSKFRSIVLELIERRAKDKERGR